jgi:EmrB/QacA subfamily drug resistance transporter
VPGALSEAAAEPRSSRGWVLASVLVGTFLGTLSNSVANIAVVDLMDDLEVDVGRAVWFVTGYVLAFAVLMPVAGRLIDVFGARRVFLTGFAAFGVASLLVAAAPTFPLVMGARVLQGIANAPVLPTVMVVVMAAFPGAERGRAMGLWASVNGAAIAIGPPLGGVVADAFGWRAIFWANAVLVGLAFLVAARHLPDTPVRHEGAVDAAGGALLTGGLVAVMLALSQGPVWGWGDPATIVLLAGGSALLAVAWQRAHRVELPFFDVSVLRNRRYAVLAGVAALQMLVLFAVLFTVPLLLVHRFELSVGVAGWVVFVLPVAMVLAGPWAGQLSHHVGVRRLTGAGSALLGGAAAALAMGTHLRSLVTVLLGLVVLGLGVAAVQSPSAAHVAEEVDDAQRGVALGLFHTVRFLSGVLGTAGAGAVFTAVTAGVEVDELGASVLTRAFVADFALAGAVAVAAVALTRCIPRPAALAARLDAA